MLNKTEAAQLMIDGLPYRESLGADDVDVAGKVASSWLFSALITAWNEETKSKHGGSSASRAVSCGQLGSLFRSFFLFFFCQQTWDKSCTLAQPCGINLSIVCRVGLCKQKGQSPFSVQTETLLLAHTCGFLRGGDGRWCVCK